MSKLITPNQVLGEIGEAAARLRFLSIGFQFDVRSRLEAGIDAIAEIMDNGRPLARMIAVQVKAKDSGRYTSETDKSFSYIIKPDDIEYWRGSNLPVIIVLYRRSDESFYWKEIPKSADAGDRKIHFDKEADLLNRNSVDKLASITVPKAGFGYYVPPLGGGEKAIVNILPLILPQDMYVASTAYSAKKAGSLLLEADEPARFDWVIHGSSFWSFHDPRESVCRRIVDLDQVEAIDTSELAYHDDESELNNFSFLLKSTLRRQYQADLNWNKDQKILYFKAISQNKSRTFHYESAKNKTESDVVNVIKSKKEPDRVEFVRHHAFSPRFECIAGRWFLIITPTYFFSTNGFTPHSYPAALLAGKKRMDKSASLRGQIIMWHRFLTFRQNESDGLFASDAVDEPCLKFDSPPVVSLSTRVPEDVWGKNKRKDEEASGMERLID